MNHRDVDTLLGRRFCCDFTVVAVAADKERTVTLRMRTGAGKQETAKLSLEELMTVIERGFVHEHAN